MPPALSTVSLADGPDAALARLPTGSGVVQFIAADGTLLMTGMAANLRRWAAQRLGRGRPPKPGRRPPLDLTPVAAALRYCETTSSFAQRLAYERLVAPVPLGQRRDLKAPGWLHLDLGQRFPRVSVVRETRGRGSLYGPFPSMRAAERAREDVQRAFPIRPCDYDFEPAPDLELGLRCVFAQVGSCAAPCLQRASEGEYAALARRVVAALAAVEARPEGLDWPGYVGAREGSRAVIAEPVRAGLELYPMLNGHVDAERARLVAGDAVAGHRLEAELARLLEARSASASPGPDDWPWVLAWLAPARCKGRLLRAPGGVTTAALAEGLRNALGGS